MQEVRRALAMVLLAVAAADFCSAQELRVSVRDSLAGAPIPWALVTARLEDADVKVHGLTNEAGQLTLRLPAVGRWVASVRRIGLAPRSSQGQVVGVGDVATVAFNMRPVPFSLPSARVVAVAGSCPRADGSHDRTSALWERVTLALQSSVTAERDRARTIPLRTVGYDRELDRSLRILSETPVEVRRGTGRPFAALNPDSLAIEGYIRSDAERILQYFAPDESTLLSSAFERTHCFETPAREASPAVAELRFRPAPSQRVPDIAGSAYVELATGALQRITFRFVNADSLFPTGTLHAGGEVQFAQQADGEWIVSAWSIRMPRMVRVTWARGPRLTGYHEVGAVVDTLAELASTAVVRSTTPAVRASEPETTSSLRKAAPQRKLATGDQVVVGGKLVVATSGPARLARDWRIGFANRQRFGVGVFLDSIALAPATQGSAVELLEQIDAVRWFVVPDSVSAPERDSDPDLAEGWIAGARLPVMTPVGGPRNTSQCHVKLFLDGERTSAAALRSVAGRAIVGVEFYARPRDVPDGFRRGGNLCGTALLWSGDGLAGQP